MVRFRKIFLWVVALAALVGGSGCGFKGDLVLPEPEKEQMGKNRSERFFVAWPERYPLPASLKNAVDEKGGGISRLLHVRVGGGPSGALVAIRRFPEKRA